MNKDLALNNELKIRSNLLSPSILLDNFKPSKPVTKELSLKAYLYRYMSILRDGWTKILLTSLVFMLLALIMALLTNAKYTTKATIRINPDPTQYINYRIDTKRPVAVNDEFFYNTETHLLRSRNLAKKVIKDLDIEKTLLKEKKYKGIVYFFTTPLKLLFKNIMNLFFSSSNNSTKTANITADDILLDNLTILPTRNSRLITMKYTSNDPILAKKIILKLIENYILSKYSNKKRISDSATDFLNKQLTKAKKSLLNAESNLIKYSQDNDIIDVESDKSITASNLESLNTAYISALNKRIAVQQSYNIKKDIAGDSSYFSNPIIQSYKKQLAKLKFLYQGNLNNFKPKHPSMIGLAHRIKQIENNILLEFNQLKYNETKTFEASLKVALDVERELKDQIKLYEDKLLNYRDNNIEYSRLKREVETSQTIYTGLLKRLKEIDVTPIVNDNIVIVDPPEVPHKKDSPRFKKYILLGFIIGLFLSLVSVLFKEFLSPIIRSSDDIEALSDNYKVLSKLPIVKSKNGIINFIKNKKTIKYFHNIYTSIPLEGSFPKCLHVTSAKNNEGKTMVAVNLAISIAKLNKSVLLIDANLNNPKIHEYFNLKNSQGLSDFLTGNDKSILNTVIKEKLFVVTAGKNKQDPMATLSNPKLLKFLEVSSNMFDHIIIDSSSILNNAESRIIANQSSATLVVVGEKKVFKQDLEDTLSLLNRAGATLVGFVNNMSTTKINT